jgi:hypothetical protein
VKTAFILFLFSIGTETHIGLFAWNLNYNLRLLDFAQHSSPHWAPDYLMILDYHTHAKLTRGNRPTDKGAGISPLPATLSAGLYGYDNTG